MTTVAQLTQQIITRISQVPGTGTQKYAEDRIGQMIQQGFDILFDQYWWPQFKFEQAFTLSGVNGLINEDISPFASRYEDIRYVFPSNNNEPLKEKPDNYNPTNLGGQNSYMMSPVADSTKLFKVWPLIATDSLYVVGRTRPARFTAQSNVPFDDTAIILYAVYDYLEDDGANPGSTAKFQRLFDARVLQLTKNLDSKPRILDPRNGTTETQWREEPF